MSRRSIKTTGQTYTKYTENVMNPIRWVVAFIELLFMAGVLRGPSLWIQVASFICIILVTIAFFSIYIYWMLYDPNRLQSEGYNLENSSLSANQEAADIDIESKKANIKISDRR